jgi:hypothetical protein
MMGPMAGKASLLLAAVLFGMGATGLILTAEETTPWGPFEPSVAPEQTLPNVESAPLFAQAIIVLPPDGGLSVPAAVADPPPVTRAAVLAETTAPPPATPTPRPPLVLGGIASDDGGVQAAGATPRPIRFIMVAGDGTDDSPTATPTPGGE